MDMPEVLKSLLEHSLPWPEKRTGRSAGDLQWLAAQVLEGARGQPQAQWQDRHLQAREGPVAVCPWSQGAECGQGFEEACVTPALGPFPKPAGLGEAMASVWPLTGAVLMWDQDRTGQGVLLKESGWMLTAYEAPSRCTLGVAEWQGLWIWAAGAWV